MTSKGCPLYEKGVGFVCGEGPSRQSFIIIGESAGVNEAMVGKPFVGGAGRVLNVLLNQGGIPRTRCYITNVVKCQPPFNKIAPYLPKAAQHCRQYLDAELRQHEGVPIILLGDVSLQYILGRDSITKHRGGVYRWDNRMVLPTIHPAALMREQKMWSVVVSDLAYAATMITKHKELPRNFVTRPTAHDVEEWFNAHVHPRKDPYFPDIETYGNSLACIGIAESKTNAISIPWWDNEEWYWSDANDALFVTGLVAWFLQNPDIKKVLQNGTFDVKVLESFGFEVNGWVADTMLMHHTVYSEMRHSLAFLHSVYIREPYYKDMFYAEKDEQEE
jgi:DNA polymerase